MSMNSPEDKTNENYIKEEEFSYDGYQVVRGEFFAHLFEPSVTFKDAKVSVNAACLNKLPDVTFVQFLVNPKEKKLAVKPCDEELRDSFPWTSRTADGKRKPKQISCEMFFAKVMKLMGWDPTYRYKVLGKLIRTKTDTLFVFDLTGAEKYKRKDAETGRLDRKAYYPVDWMDRFGVPVNEHQDLTLVSIFDDYTVFRIDKEEEREGKIQNDTDNITGHEEEKDKDTPDDTKAYE